MEGMTRRQRKRSRRNARKMCNQQVQLDDHVEHKNAFHFDCRGCFIKCFAGARSVTRASERFAHDIYFLTRETKIFSFRVTGQIKNTKRCGALYDMINRMRCMKFREREMDKHFYFLVVHILFTDEVRHICVPFDIYEVATTNDDIAIPTSVWSAQFHNDDIVRLLHACNRVGWKPGFLANNYVIVGDNLSISCLGYFDLHIGPSCDHPGQRRVLLDVKYNTPKSKGFFKKRDEESPEKSPEKSPEPLPKKPPKKPRKKVPVKRPESRVGRRRRRRPY